MSGQLNQMLRIQGAFIWLKMHDDNINFRTNKPLKMDAKLAHVIKTYTGYTIPNHLLTNNHFPMDAIQFSKIAKDHFESIMPKNISNGWEKFVTTDGLDCLIVRSDYRPKPGEIVFHCSIRNGIASAELYRTGKQLTKELTATN